MDAEDKIKAEIDKHEQKIKELKEKAVKASGDTKVKLEAEIKELKSKIDPTKTKW
jgi:phage shock protein A